MFDELAKRDEINEEEVMYVRNLFIPSTDIDLANEIIEDETPYEYEYDVNEEEVTATEAKLDSDEETEKSYFNFKCHMCDPPITFPKMYYLSTHCRTVHYCLPKVHCDHCNKTLQTVKAVNQHFELHFKNSFKYKCERCEKFYKTQIHYNNHVEACNDSLERKFYCEICKKRFKEKRHLTVHMNTHLPEEEKFTNTCNICDKKYSSVFSLRQHIKVVHIREAFFKCDHCDKSFSRKANLDSHLNVHLEEKRYECDICSLKLKTKANLRIHKKLHTNDAVACKICDKKFKTSNQLINHMIVHSEVKKYECGVCNNASYKRSKDLQSHMLSVHLNVRKYQCQWCSRTFNNNSNYRKHKKSAHPLELEQIEGKSKENEFDETEYYILEELE